MGKKIHFYMNEEIEKQFLNYIVQNSFKLVYFDFENSEMKIYTSIEEINSEIRILYLYKEEYGEIYYRNNRWKSIDNSKSPIIEFLRTRIKEEKIEYGRLYVDSDIRFIDDESKKMFNKDYRKLTQWIKLYLPLYEKLDNEKWYYNEEVELYKKAGYQLI